MELLFQFTIILGISFAGEVLAAVLPLPIPAGIYGLVLMLLCLITGIIPLKKVKKAADFLILIMPVMFIGPGVALVEQGEVLRRLALPLVLLCTVSTAAVMAVTGRVAQRLIRRRKGKENEND